MAGIPGRAPRRYTHEEKVALVTEIDRRLSGSTSSLWVVAREAGTTGTTYLAWRKAGIEPEKRPTRRVFSPADRERLLAEVERRHDEGQTIEAACRELGISDKLFRSWRAKAMPPLRPVEVITALVPVQSLAMTVIPEPQNLTLVAPGGYRIEGLTTESAAALLRALA